MLRKALLGAALASMILASSAGADTGDEVITACVNGETVQITYDEFSVLHESGAYYGPCTPLPDTAMER